MKTSSDNVKGCTGEVKELDLFEIEPDEIPEHIHRFFFQVLPRRKEKTMRSDLQAKVGKNQVDGSRISESDVEFLGYVICYEVKLSAMIMLPTILCPCTYIRT